MKTLFVLFGILVGLAAAAAAIAGAGYGALALHPPGGLDLRTVAGATEYLQSAPLQTQALAVGAWALAGLLGGWVGAIAARPRPGFAAVSIGALLTIAVIALAGRIPQPEWMPVLAMLLPMPFALLGWRLPPSSAEP